MSQFNTIPEVWAALDAGKTVYWSNKSYKVYVEDVTNPNYPGQMYSSRDGKMLSIRCISNHFGGIIHPAELAQLFIDESESGFASLYFLGALLTSSAAVSLLVSAFAHAGGAL